MFFLFLDENIEKHLSKALLISTHNIHVWFLQEIREILIVLG